MGLEHDSEPGPSVLGQSVALARQVVGWRMTDLAHASGISLSTLSRLEAGQVSQLKSNALRDLARTLGVTTDYLLGTSPHRIPAAYWEDANLRWIVRVLATMEPKEIRRELEELLRRRGEHWEQTGRVPASTWEEASREQLMESQAAQSRRGHPAKEDEK